MRSLPTILFLSLISLCSFSSDKILYGEDDRVEADSFYAYEYWSQKDAVAGMVEKDRLWEYKGYLNFEYISLETLGVQGSASFLKQPLLPTCSGFLITDELLVTASHCIKDQKDCDSHYWFFDYSLDKARDFRFKKEDAFSCKEIVKTKFLPKEGIDFTVIRLDKKVLDREPLKFRSSGKVSNDQELVMIGHPLGLPKKVTKNGYVWHNDSTHFFSANLDAYSGNSGSPVLNAQTKEVEGILVRGSQDFEDQDDGTMTVNICVEGDRREECLYGEDITRITSLGLEKLL